MTIPVQHGTFNIERVYDASPARVFKAFADEGARMRWFVQADRLDHATYKHQFFVGGREESTFRWEAGQQMYRNDTYYHDIVADDRIVFSYTMDKQNEDQSWKRFSVSLTTIEFKAEGERTRLVLHEQDVYLDGEASDAASREEGTRVLLEELALEINRMQAAA